MPAKIFPNKLLAIACLVVLLTPAAAATAQTATPSAQSTIFINDVKVFQPVEDIPGVQGLSLEVTFTLLDAEGQVMVGDRIAENGAEFLLGSDPPYPAGVQAPIGSYTIVVVIDGSATLANFAAGADFRAMRDSITIALGQGPEGSTYMVRQFHDAVPLVQGFTQNQEELQKKIKAIQAKQGGKSCLNNAVDQALTDLSTVAGRKAVFVITASADSCSQKTAKDVTDRARQIGAQIYAVGLRGYTITQDELNALTNPSGGLAAFESIGELGFGLSHIMAALKSQWQAKSTVYPFNGPQLATLFVTLKDGTSLASADIPFTSNQDYPKPPRIELKGQILSYNGGINFNLDFVSRDKIKELSLTVINKKTGLDAVTDLSLKEFGEQNKVDLPNLEVGETYTLLIAAKDEQGLQLSQTGGEFQYAPPPPGISIEKLDTPTLEKPQYVITVATENLEEVVKFQIFLGIEQSTDPMPDTVQTIPVGEDLILPVPDSLPDGQYQVVIRALDASDKALAEIRSQAITYRKPTWLDKLIAFLQTNPLGLVAITAVCCVAFLGLVAVVWFIIPKPGSGPKQVDLVVPEKRRSSAPITDSGIFGAPESAPESAPRPPPQRRAAPPPPPPQPEPQPEPVPQANLPRAWFTAHSQTTAIQLTYITRTPFNIGRRDGNELVVKVDNSAGVSGQHATITFINGQFYIQDDRSTYGTTVNGKSAPKGMPVPLENGAIIGLGPKVTIEFHVG